MISIWFWYAKDYDFLMVLESLRFLIWFWYDFLMVLESLRFLIWFWYDFLMVLESLRFLIWFWYDFLMVLESLRFLDMIFLWFWGASVFLIWFRYCFRPATSPTPVAGPRPHLPRPSPDPPPIPWPDSGTRGTLWFQTLVSFWFFWISMDVAACYRPTEFSLNISFTILWVRLARRRGFQCCC